MAPHVPTNAELRWRVDDHQRRLVKVEEETDQIPVLVERIKALTERVRVLTTALWSVVGGLVLLTVSVLIAAGRIG